MAQLLLGKEVTASLNEEIRRKVAQLNEQGVTPKLGIVRIGEREDDISYERGATKRCETLGVAFEKFLLPADASEEEVLKVIQAVNEDDSIHGVLLFRPLPRHLNEDKIVNALAVEKDVDGITDLSMASVFMGRGAGYAPCTPSACMRILDHYGIDCTGKKAVVIGRSNIVGLPVSKLLLDANATVTMAHSRTRNLAEVTRGAEILVVAIGRPKFVTAEMVSPGAVVIDVGVNRDPETGKLCGDVDFAAIEPKASVITPVPGGVGPMTICCLMENTIECFLRRAGR